LNQLLSTRNSNFYFLFIEIAGKRFVVIFSKLSPAIRYICNLLAISTTTYFYNFSAFLAKEQL